jgi:hypothetical protein
MILQTLEGRTQLQYAASLRHWQSKQVQVAYAKRDRKFMNGVGPLD